MRLGLSHETFRSLMLEPYERRRPKTSKVHVICPVCGDKQVTSHLDRLRKHCWEEHRLELVAAKEEERVKDLEKRIPQMN